MYPTLLIALQSGMKTLYTSLSQENNCSYSTFSKNRR